MDRHLYCGSRSYIIKYALQQLSLVYTVNPCLWSQYDTVCADVDKYSLNVLRYAIIALS